MFVSKWISWSNPFASSTFFPDTCASRTSRRPRLSQQYTCPTVPYVRQPVERSHAKERGELSRRKHVQDHDVNRGQEMAANGRRSGGRWRVVRLNRTRRRAALSLIECTLPGQLTQPTPKGSLIVGQFLVNLFSMNEVHRPENAILRKQDETKESVIEKLFQYFWTFRVLWNQ